MPVSIVRENIAPFRSQSQSDTQERSAHEKSTPWSFHSRNMLFVRLSPENTEKSRIHFSNVTSKRKLLHFWKWTPRILQSEKLTSCIPVSRVFTLLRLHPIIRQLRNLEYDKSTSEKSHPTNSQSSYSHGTHVLVKSFLVYVSENIHSMIYALYAFSIPSHVSRLISMSAFMSFDFFSLSPFFMYSVKFAGMSCQDTQYLSATQPHISASFTAESFS